MKSLPAVVILLLLTPFAIAQNSQAAPSQPQTTAAQPQTLPPGLEPILARIQKAAEASKADLTGLHIEKWKIDRQQKAELTKIADSLQRNLTSAVPDLIKDVRSSNGSVSTTFKLYHNLNVVYEYMNYLADSASVLSKDDDSYPLSREAGTLDTARQDLSNFVEQAATNLEDKLRLALAPRPAPQELAPKKVVVDDSTSKKSATSRKKKTSPPSPQPVSTPN
jgi:hypothetical protein